MKESDDCTNLLTILETKWAQEIERGKKREQAPSIMRAFIHAYGCRFVSFSIIGFFAEVMTTMMVFFIRYMIAFIEEENPQVG